MIADSKVCEFRNLSVIILEKYPLFSGPNFMRIRCFRGGKPSCALQSFEFIGLSRFQNLSPVRSRY